MAAPLNVTIEGEEALTRRLARLESKMQKKVLVNAAKDTAKVVKKDYQARVPAMSGAMRDAVGIFVRRYNHKVGTGKFRLSARTGHEKSRFEVKRVVSQDIGASVTITRKRLQKEVGKIKRKRKSVPIDRNGGGVFFYPSQIELGNRNVAGQRPLTKSLYQNEGELRDIYVGHLRSLVSQAGAT